MDERIQRISKYLEEKFFKHIDLSDLPKLHGQPDKQLPFLRTRSLTAHFLSLVSGVAPVSASLSVIDSGKDNGIDGVLYDAPQKKLVLVTTKFHSSETVGPEQQDFLKFKNGIEKLLTGDLSSFTDKIKVKAEEIELALGDDKTTIDICYVNTSTVKSNTDSNGPLVEYIQSLNADASGENWVFFKEFGIDYFISELTKEELSKEIKISLGLTNYGFPKEPYFSVYGQVSASEVFDWYATHGKYIFSENIRGYLGSQDSKVNQSIATTLLESPDSFFYLNNGIVAICDSFKKTPKYGKETQQGEFVCTNFRIVNGAQTVGSIGNSFTSIDEIKGDPKIFIKVISLDGAPVGTAQKITIASNSQNQIDVMDFASMEEVQLRLESEIMLKHGVRYERLRGVGYPEGSISMKDAATGLICFQDDVKMVTGHKRESGKIWQNLHAGVYVKVFNATTTSNQVRNTVYILNKLKKMINSKRITRRTKEFGFSSSGDMLILHLHLVLCQIGICILMVVIIS